MQYITNGTGHLNAVVIFLILDDFLKTGHSNIVVIFYSALLYQPQNGLSNMYLVISPKTLHSGRIRT
jgi:hypothetical protein